MLRALWLILIIVINASLGCSSPPTPLPDLLGELRAKEQMLNSGTSDKHKTQTKKTPTHAVTQEEPEEQEEPQELEEVKIITPAMLERDYPSSNYITGVGYTEDLNLNQAMLNAKEQVAASVNSQIQSVLTVIISANDDRDQSNEQRQQTTQRVQFNRAELIKIDPKRTGCDEERCVAVAYLERGSLAQETLEDFKPLAARFERAADDCVALVGKGQVGRFAERFAALERAYAKLRPIGAELEVILGETRFKDWRALQRRHRRISDEREEMIAAAPIILDVSSIKPSSLGAALNEVHREDFIAIGAQTRPALNAGTPCQGQPSNALHALIEGSVTTQTLLGTKVYQLPYTFTVKTCQDHRVVARFKLSFKFSVPDNSTFERSALSKLKSVSKETRLRLYDALRLTLPLNQP